MASFSNDNKFGLAEEEKVLRYLRMVFRKDNVTRTTDKYCKYDFEGDTAIYELKSRTNRKNMYPTTLMPYDKIINTEKKQIFVFNFTDGIYYVAYNEDTFKPFIAPFVRNQRIDYTDVRKLYFHVPIEILKPIYKTNN